MYVMDYRRATCPPGSSVHCFVYTLSLCSLAQCSFEAPLEQFKVFKVKMHQESSCYRQEASCVSRPVPSPVPQCQREEWKAPGQPAQWRTPRGTSPGWRDPTRSLRAAGCPRPSSVSMATGAARAGWTIEELARSG